MDTYSKKYPDVPGIHLINNQTHTSESAHTFGNYSVWHTGKLASISKNKSWTIFFDGILFRDYNTSQSDAEFVLSLFEKSENIDDILALEGFYNIILINNSGSIGYFFSDALCSRPQYGYKKGSELAFSPSPTFFREFELDITLNRMHSLEVLRFLHNGNERTLANEIFRILPGHYYKFDESGAIDILPYINFSQSPNEKLTEDEATDWMYEICKKPMEAIFRHPDLKDLDVYLPLTSGLDSRHLLGQTIELGKSPKKLWHVKITNKDYVPVRDISSGLNIPLESPSFFEIEFKMLIKRWLERSAGLVHFHQFYLLNILEHSPNKGAVGFNGQLMDKFLGLAPVTTVKKNGTSLVNQKWAKTYSRPSIMSGLFKDYKELNEALHNVHSEFVDTINGEDWYKMAIYEFHHKSLHYTGITDTMTSDEYFSFSPGASIEALRFIQSVPYSIGGEKRIRLKALEKKFPEIGRFPDEDGVPLIHKKSRPRESVSPIRKNLVPFFKWVFSGFKGDPASNTEHEWLRKSPVLKKIHKRVIFEGLIFKDDFLNGKAAKKSWYIHQAGGFQAWTLMSLLSIEMSYRLLYKKQPIDDIIDWLFE